VDLLNAAAARVAAREHGLALPDAPWVVAVGYEDSSPAVNWQVGQLIEEVAPVGIRGVEARAGGAAEPLWQALVGLTGRPDAAFTWKANLLPGAVADFCRAAGDLHKDLLLHAHAGSGIVRGHAAGLTREGAQAMLKILGEKAAAAGGNVVLPRCPPEWKRHLPVWGAPRGDIALMRRVKEQLDPRRLFNPGRFVGGI
jgi:glycolate oxidase FAD binding subunit